MTSISVARTGNMTPKATPSKAEVARAHKIARDFEAIMTEAMVKSMRSSVGKNTLINGGKGEEMFSSVLDQEYAKEMANHNALGIARTMEEKILQQSGYRNYKNPDAGPTLFKGAKK